MERRSRFATAPPDARAAPRATGSEIMQRLARFERAGRGVVADDAHDPGPLNAPFLDRLQDRLEIGSPPRRENGNLQVVGHIFLEIMRQI